MTKGIGTLSICPTAPPWGSSWITAWSALHQDIYESPWQQESMLEGWAATGDGITTSTALTVQTGMAAVQGGGRRSHSLPDVGLTGVTHQGRAGELGSSCSQSLCWKIAWLVIFTSISDKNKTISTSKKKQYWVDYKHIKTKHTQCLGLVLKIGTWFFHLSFSPGAQFFLHQNCHTVFWVLFKSVNLFLKKKKKIYLKELQRK